MDGVANTHELPSPKQAYEPPCLDDLGKVDELTGIVGGSVTDDS